MTLAIIISAISVCMAVYALMRIAALEDELEEREFENHFFDDDLE